MEPSLRNPSRRVLVPPDGSDLAAKALPLGAQLAQEWNAPLYLSMVIPALTSSGTQYDRVDGALPHDYREDVVKARAYLGDLAAQQPVETHTHVFVGGVIDTLEQAVDEWDITDVVMGSHGRTGLMRVILGSVADGLIHRLHIPIVILPSLAHLAEKAVQAGNSGGVAVPV